MGRALRSRRSERGAALIEAAIVTPVFFALIFGIFEVGLLFRNELTTSNASQQGARAASVGGSGPQTDYLVIRSVEHGLAPIDLQRLDVVVVFRADGPDDTVPAACLTASQVYDPLNPAQPACNRYTPIDFFAEYEDPVSGVDTGNFQCGTLAIDRYWCPDDREISLGAGTDYVGVYVQTRHDFISGLFGSNRTLDATTIIRLEPAVG